MQSVFKGSDLQLILKINHNYNILVVVVRDIFNYQQHLGFGRLFYQIQAVFEAFYTIKAPSRGQPAPSRGQPA